MSLFQKINAFLLDIIFPKTCLKCGKEGDYFCRKCVEAAIDEDGGSGKTYTDIPYIKKLIVCKTFEEAPYLKKVIHYFKYYFVKDLRKPLGAMMLHQFKKHFKSGNIVLVPVPLHKKRLRNRSFNQSMLLAGEIAGNTVNVEITDALVRWKNTKAQAKLSREERLKNVEYAFMPNPALVNAIRGKEIVIVDDVCTTGTTIKECAKALKTADAKEIYGIVIARGC